MIILGRDILGQRNGICESGKLVVYPGHRKIRELGLNERGRSGCD